MKKVSVRWKSHTKCARGTYLFFDEEVMQLLSRDLAVAIDINDAKLGLQLALEVVLNSLLFDAPIDGVWIGQALPDVQVRVHDGRCVRAGRTGRDQRVDVSHCCDWVVSRIDRKAVENLVLN